MFEIVLGAVVLLGGIAVVLWLIELPGDENEEELAGFVTANWNEVKGWIDPSDSE